MHSAGLEPTLLILLGTRTIYQATGDVLLSYKWVSEGELRGISADSVVYSFFQPTARLYAHHIHTLLCCATVSLCTGFGSSVAVYDCTNNILTT